MIDRAAQGDRAAFDHLTERYYSPLRAFVGQRIAPAYTDDVVQETLLAAWVALPRYEPQARFKTWLFRIALNKTRDEGRRHTRRSQNESLLLETVVGKDTLNHVENQVVVQEMLTTLDEDERLLLELYYRDGLTLAEVAELLGRNLNTVKHRFYRLHSQLADRIEDMTPQKGRIS